MRKKNRKKRDRGRAKEGKNTKNHTKNIIEFQNSGDKSKIVKPSIGKT